MTNSDFHRSAATEDDSMRRIILALFNPMPDGHEKGCLANDPHIRPRGPCICKYGEAAGEYLWALREAKKIASEHYGQKEVEESRRLEEPVGLVEAAALVATDAQPEQQAALAWHCCDERYPWIQGIVTTSEITLDAWRDSGIKYQPLYPLAAQPPAAPVETKDGNSLIERLRKQPSSFNDALRTMDEAASFITKVMWRARSHPGSSAGNVDLQAIERWFNSLPCESIGQTHWLALVALLNEPQGAGMWQSIETAPKDGTSALFIERNGTVKVDEWRSCCDDRFYRERGFHSDRYTHWMPLPSSPLSRPQSERGAS